VAFAILLPVTSPARARPSLASFWNDLPRDGKLLLSTVAVETLGTGLVLPFGFIYLHEVRGFTIETAGSLLAFSSTPLMAALALALLGAAGGVFWPGFNAMIGAVVPSGIRQRYFGINLTLVNLGIGIGGCWRGPSSTSIDRGRSWPSTSATRSASWRLLRCFSDPFDR